MREDNVFFLLSFPFFPTSFFPSFKCLFLQHVPTSQFLIASFQVGFMRAKLISVSKFSWKKIAVGLIVLVSSPVSGAQQ